MPRLPSALLRKARSLDPNLVPLLQTCRDLPSARKELRWLHEHVISLERLQKDAGPEENSIQRLLKRLCIARGRGKPLQYILGTEYFGELEIACREGVLIPRQETAASITHLAQRLRNGFSSASTPPPSPLRILDLCTGTGCMSLLLHHLLGSTDDHHHKPIRTQTLGIDISPRAISLARINVRRLLPAKERSSIRIARADVLAGQAVSSPTAIPSLRTLLKYLGNPSFDILIANPPYISSTSYASSTTTRSVRNFEPKLALVPPGGGNSCDETVDQADLFYPALLRAADIVGTKVMLMEVADMAQAVRVAKMASAANLMDPACTEGRRGGWEGVEIWRDDPGAKSNARDDGVGNEPDRVRNGNGQTIHVRGSGNGRTVVCWRGEGVGWMDDCH